MGQIADRPVSQHMLQKDNEHYILHNLPLYAHIAKYSALIIFIVILLLYIKVPQLNTAHDIIFIQYSCIMLFVISQKCLEMV